MNKLRPCLVDTPLLVRLANSSDLLHSVAFRAVTVLHSQGEQLCITSQNLIEFRNVATRPVAENGLGFSVLATEEKSEEFESLFTLLEDNAAIFSHWKTLVHDANVVGKQVHDARLAACCQVYTVESVLTFNRQHFVRFLPYMTGWNVIDPHSL